MTLDNLISSALKFPLSMRLQHIDKHAGRIPRVTGGLQIKLHAHFKLSMGGHQELDHVMDDTTFQNLTRTAFFSFILALRNMFSYVLDVFETS